MPLSLRVSAEDKFPNNLTIGYNNYMAKKQSVKEAASLMGKRSAAARRKKWGKEEFVRRMQEYGKLGGRPKKATGKKRKEQKEAT